MTVAVLGPGGVGGLIAGALDRAGEQVLVIAQPSTAAVINERGLRVSSVTLGDFTARPRAEESLSEPPEVLIVATKAAGLSPALRRIECGPALVVPLLNGLDHLAVLRERFEPATVTAGTIRVKADRPSRAWSCTQARSCGSIWRACPPLSRRCSISPQADRGRGAREGP